MAMFDEEAMVAAIGRWASIESPTHDRDAVNRMMDAVSAEAADAAIAVERVAGRDGLGDCVLLRAGRCGKGPGILVLSHLDTVHPIGTLAQHLPVRRDGDRLFGPGVCDMKGGAYLAFAAFRAVAAAGTARVPLTFLFTSDEEIGSPTTRALIEDLAGRASHVLVTEPGREGNRCVTGRKGVGRFDVHVEGRPAHSGARHQDGRSAIREAARQILAIEDLTDYGRGVTTTVGLVSGGTAANVIPQHARFSVDLRVANAADGELYSSRILGLVPRDPDVRVTVTGGMNRPPYEKSAAGEALYQTARSLAAGIGFELGEVPLTGGGSDANFTAPLGVPTLDGLGIDGEGAHTLQECGYVSSIVPRARLMEGLLTTLG